MIWGNGVSLFWIGVVSKSDGETIDHLFLVSTLWGS